MKYNLAGKAHISSFLCAAFVCALSPVLCGAVSPYGFVHLSFRRSCQARLAHGSALALVGVALASYAFRTRHEWRTKTTVRMDTPFGFGRSCNSAQHIACAILRFSWTPVFQHHRWLASRPLGVPGYIRAQAPGASRSRFWPIYREVRLQHRRCATFAQRSVAHPPQSPRSETWPTPLPPRRLPKSCRPPTSAPPSSRMSCARWRSVSPKRAKAPLCKNSRPSRPGDRA